MPKRRPYRGKAHWVVPPARDVERATERPWRPRGRELDYYRVLDFVLAEHEELKGQDPRLVAIYNLVRQKAWAELENTLVFHYLMLALGETDRGDRGALENILNNRFPDEWQDRRHIKVSGGMTVGVFDADALAGAYLRAKRELSEASGGPVGVSDGAGAD